MTSLVSDRPRSCVCWFSRGSCVDSCFPCLVSQRFGHLCEFGARWTASVLIHHANCSNMTFSKMIGHRMENLSVKRTRTRVMITLRRLAQQCNWRVQAQQKILSDSVRRRRERGRNSNVNNGCQISTCRNRQSAGSAKPAQTNEHDCECQGAHSPIGRCSRRRVAAVAAAAATSCGRGSQKSRRRARSRARHQRPAKCQSGNSREFRREKQQETAWTHARIVVRLRRRWWR